MIPFLGQANEIAEHDVQDTQGAVIQLADVINDLIAEVNVWSLQQDLNFQIG